MSFRIMRHYQHGEKRRIKTVRTLEEAQAHCRAPETSSFTCTNKATLSHASNRGRGDWFDSYEEIKTKEGA